ncbi:hypothetical protein JBE04_19505 [Streptomyces sp. PRKS01-29]|nr:hypothetical protein [Streptomyces sabulosicollis]MBI0296580.1 hypothetical protein [Streptomyces sabulosicollis]
MRVARIELPTLCHDDRLSLAGSCRTCLVRADGQIVSAVSPPATPGAAVEVGAEDLRALRRDAVAAWSAVPGQ